MSKKTLLIFFIYPLLYFKIKIIKISNAKMAVFLQKMFLIFIKKEERFRMSISYQFRDSLHILFLFVIYVFSNIIYRVEVSTSPWSYRVTHAFRCLRDPIYIKAINARLTTACFQRSRDCAISDGVSAIQWALFLNPLTARGAHGAFYRLICVYPPPRIGEETRVYLLIVSVAIVRHVHVE